MKAKYLLQSVMICTLVLLMCKTSQAQVVWDFYCMRLDRSTYTTAKTYYPYRDTSASTCYNGQTWCTKTTHNNVKLMHLHFVEDFDWPEQVDANRWLEEKPEPDSTNRLFSATTTYNCHSYALGPNTTTWNVDQVTTLNNDYDMVTGTCADPFKKGQKCRYAPGDHNAVIESPDEAAGPQYNPGWVIQTVKSKWGAYGAYVTTDDIQDYSSVALVYKPK
jgi:hypothetical protein